MNKRLIYAEDAIKALEALFVKRLMQFDYDSYEKADEKTQLVCDGISESIGCLLNLPSAQPETHEEHTKTHACDLISRQAAIDALGDMVMNWTDSDYELGQLNQWKADRKAIIDLPSAQPLTEEDYIELRDRFGDEVESVVRDMVSGEGKRWMT